MVFVSISRIDMFGRMTRFEVCCSRGELNRQTNFWTGRVDAMRKSLTKESRAERAIRYAHSQTVSLCFKAVVRTKCFYNPW